MVKPSETRISPAEALRLLKASDAAYLMGLADTVRRKLHGRNAYFVHSLNLNPTNVCVNRCRLCAFWRDPEAPDAYVLDLEQARLRLAEAQGLGLTDLHIVGGVLPELDLAYYETLIRLSKDMLPSVLVQGMTAVEIQYLAEQENLSVQEVLNRLKEAGLGAIPGGGAEIFASEARKRICAHKISAEQWLSTHEQAHATGLPTNATMLFGHIETPEQIVDHLARIRDLQDRTHGFQAFVPLPFHPEGTGLPVKRGPGGDKIVRIVALARIFLDNVPHIRMLADYVDRKLLQVLTYSGVDDVGGTSMDERIAQAAGAPTSHKFVSTEEIADFLDALGWTPVLVNSAYVPADIAGAVSLSATAADFLRNGDQPSAVEFQMENPCRNPPLPPPRMGTFLVEPPPRRGTCGVESPPNRGTLRVEPGRRLSADEAVTLYNETPIHELGSLAHARRKTVTPGSIATFIVDRIISTTNVCEVGCGFCAFHVAPGAPGAFALSSQDIVAKSIEAAESGATQIMLQGGLNPELDLNFYERVFADIKRHTKVWLHSLSPPEIFYLARISGLEIRAVLKRLVDAGLDSLPGGGAEILDDDIRRAVSPGKITADQWFEVMRAAHELGMKTTATMVYGLGESTAQLVGHLIRIRDLQDATGGFTAFIPWSFQSGRTRLSFPARTGVDYLSIVALARLVLDNVPHVQAGWVTEGPDLAQLALSFGADDFGGVLMEEQVVRATGVSYSVTTEQVISLIREAGMTPAQRNTQYEILREF